MTTQREPLTAGLDFVIPPDIACWVDAPELTRLALQSAETVQGLPSRWRGGSLRGEWFSGPMLLTLLTYAYGRGALTVPEVEAFAAADPVACYLCGGQRPGVGNLLSFRRQHREQLRTSLTRFLGLAWQQWAWSDQRTWLASGRGADFGSEAVRRLDRAVRLDSMLLDD